MTVASGWFWPWYVTWVVALAALLAPGELVVAALLLAGGALTLYAFLPLYTAPVYGFRSLFAFGPALGYLLYRHRAWLRGILARVNALFARDSKLGLMLRGPSFIIRSGAHDTIWGACDASVRGTRYEGEE